MSRIKDFYNFTKKLPIDINSISSLDLRNMFSKSLGVQKYYRGMILTPTQLAEIKKNGISYNNFNVDEAKEVLHNLLCETESSGTSYKMLMWDKANGYSQGNPLISVTQIREIAKTVPTSFTKISPDKKNYIIELEIPKINVIEPTGEFHVTYPGFGVYDKNNKKIPIEKVESFVPFIIRPNYIKSISSV